jgi:hypothetical protein
MAQESELVVPGTIALISIIPLLWVIVETGCYHETRLSQ